MAVHNYVFEEKATIMPLFIDLKQRHPAQHKQCQRTNQTYREQEHQRDKESLLCAHAEEARIASSARRGDGLCCGFLVGIILFFFVKG